MGKNVIGAIIIIFAVSFMATGAYAAMQIDGDLSDWGGVSPFYHWNSNRSSVDKKIEDNNRFLGGAVSDEEPYDVEALYFDDDAQYLYFAMVGSYPLTGGVAGDFAIDPTPNDNYYEYGIKLRGQLTVSNQIQHPELWLNPAWTGYGYRNFYGLVAPVAMANGTPIGVTDVFYKNLGNIEGPFHNFPPQYDFYGDTYLLEGRIDRSLISPVLENGDSIRLHWSETCSNDAITLNGTVNNNVPEPATLLLFGIGGLPLILGKRKSDCAKSASFYII